MHVKSYHDFYHEILTPAKFDNKFALHTIVTCLQNALHLAFLVTNQWLHEE